MFNNKNLVEEHYKHVHKESILDWSNSNFINKCQTCYQGPFPTFQHLLKHLGETHETSVETYVKRIGGLSFHLKLITHVIIYYYS